MRARRSLWFSAALIFGAAVSAFATTRIQLTPKFSVGQVLRYRIESTTKSTGKTTSPIANPEGGSQSNQAIHMQVRLEVLSATPDQQVRLRAVYEKSSAESESDALDLTANSFTSRFNRLEGRTFEFTLVPSGDVTGVQDLTAALAGQSTTAISPELSWLQEVMSATNLPKNGIALGQKWKTDKPIPGALLASLTSHVESTYLRDEPCNGAASANAGEDTAPRSASGGDCAVILSQVEISRPGSPHSDATPDDFRRNGLRTSGIWTGTGETLNSISLSTGLLLSSTQSMTQNMDYQVVSASTGSTLHHTGKSQSQTQITQVPAWQ
jgi:hypothetical protein